MDPAWDNEVAHMVWSAFFRVKDFQELSKHNFGLFGNLVANSQLKGGVEAKLKIFESLQQNLYDIISENPAKILYSAFFDIPEISSDKEDTGPTTDLGLLRDRKSVV